MTEDEDIFHDIVMTEEISQKEGYEEGLLVGRKKGIVEGNRLGWEKGASIGSEVGFYAGFSKTLLEKMKSGPNTKQRVINSLEKIAALAESYPLTDPLDPDLQSYLEDIRSRFKQVCSVLGISPGQPSSLSSPEISF